MFRRICLLCGCLWLASFLIKAPAGHANITEGVAQPEAGSKQQRTNQCPRLLGPQKTRSANKRHRERDLMRIIQEPTGVTVIHSNVNWEKPTLLNLRGITLEERHPLTKQEAVIQLAPKRAETLGCPAGQYIVRVDDALGRGTRVLAILSNTLLLEHRSQLYYLLAEGAKPQRWLMAWMLRGKYRFPRATAKSSPPRRPSKKRRPRRRTSKPPVRRTNRRR